MNQTTELSDIVSSESSFLSSARKVITKGAELVYQNFAQAMDANVCLVSGTSLLHSDNPVYRGLGTVLLCWSAKQYMFGWFASNDSNEKFQEWEKTMNPEEIIEKFSCWQNEL